jgi:hypothetical protein
MFGYAWQEVSITDQRLQDSALFKTWENIMFKSRQTPRHFLKILEKLGRFDNEEGAYLDSKGPLKMQRMPQM